MRRIEMEIKEPGYKIGDYVTEEENNNNHVYNYTCPNCNTILSEVEDCNYCPECGTKLDWSRNE